ncbi:Plastocyanin [Geodermatophilus dictyosporus]|uniref:Plastocyanin n=1 Tax=Geodermatophilus dictyosporus TaxID=1523247 RepID=A0A1I5U5V1_9ACTN|nr:plastocyanin/azurin family copper-binding protein [Geodermatophilus dictyosporus]SFP90624.1 Plastocyanin [Geodermatophilus dictyosporus]
MPRPTRRSAALVLALGLGLLSGCSDDGGTSVGAATTSSHEGEHSESPSASASTEGTPSSSAAGGSAAPESAVPTSEAAPVEARAVTATEGEMYIELSEDSFSPGEYTIEVVNEGNGTHDLVVERDGADIAASDTIGPGQSTTLTVTLEAGEYVFYCSIANHRAMGMATSVTVAA